MAVQRPSFDDLPLRKDGPPGNAWGLFGDDDECGMLNLLTPENTAAAAREIVDGVRVSTDWELDRMTEPCWGRDKFEHRILSRAPHAMNDDQLNFNTQVSTQWDGFRHYGYQKENLYFNGRTPEQLTTTTANGIHAWVQKGGIVGRGVLLDYLAWAEAKGVVVDPFSTTVITVAELEQIAAAQNVTLKQGDILIIRTGWVREYQKADATKRKTLAGLEDPPGIGIESSETTLRWIWDHGFSAMAGDHPSLEAWPCQDLKHWLHEWLLAGWGLPIGELFSLEQLSEECRKRNRWSFFFSSMPLKVPGGVASPPNSYAIF